MTIPILLPITAQVQLPASYALAEAWAAYQAALVREKVLQPKEAQQAAERACDRAWGDMVQAAVRLDPRSLGAPEGITSWVEKKIKEMNYAL